VTATLSGFGKVMGDFAAFCFILALLSSGTTWIMGSDRSQAVAGYDGAFIGWFGVFSQRFGTPVRVNVMSGITSTIFMVAAVNLLQGSEAAVFGVVLNMAISTTLISYLLIFPTLIKLRRDYPDVPRPFVVPGGNAGMWITGVLCTAWALLGSWVAVFPDTLEHLFGAEYDFPSVWGVSQARFEVFTLGTLAVVLAFALLGYVLGADVRRRAVDVSLTGDRIVDEPV
jgi:amino acid transporter